MKMGDWLPIMATFFLTGQVVIAVLKKTGMGDITPT